jgi:hypothetical protein
LTSIKTQRAGNRFEVLFSLALSGGFFSFSFHFSIIPLDNATLCNILKDISKKSIGWIFSVWAQRPMQEDLSVAT